MAKVTYATGIDYVQGSLAKPVKKEGHSHGTYLIGKHRTAPTTNPKCTSLFIQNANTYDRTSALSTDELAARARFAAVSGLVKARKADLSKLSDDQIVFKAQRDLPNGKKTMKAWYWFVCGEEYDDALDGE